MDEITNIAIKINRMPMQNNKNRWIMLQNNYKTIMDYITK